MKFNSIRKEKKNLLTLAIENSPKVGKDGTGRWSGGSCNGPGER